MMRGVPFRGYAEFADVLQRGCINLGWAAFPARNVNNLLLPTQDGGGPISTLSRPGFGGGSVSREDGADQQLPHDLTPRMLGGVYAARAGGKTNAIVGDPGQSAATPASNCRIRRRYSAASSVGMSQRSKTEINQKASRISSGVT